MKGDPPISSVYSQGQKPRPTPAERDQQTFELRRAAWRSMGLVIVDPADVDDDWLRQGLINYARKLFGGLR